MGTHQLMTYAEDVNLASENIFTTQNLVFLSYWYRKKRLQMHF
jgi:hypothetical protein